MTDHKNMRLVVTNKTTIDCPKLPATKLIDDIEHVVVELNPSVYRDGPMYYNYVVENYPLSHHMGT